MSTKYIVFITAILSTSFSFANQSNPQVDDLLNRYNQILKKLDEFKGSIVAFSSETCPVGWKDYDLAYGKFIRGIDKSVKSPRKPGSLEEDSIKSHEHEYMDIYWSESFGHTYNGIYHTIPGNQGATKNDYDNKGLQLKRETIADQGTDISLETRPVNVALLYCTKL